MRRKFITWSQQSIRILLGLSLSMAILVPPPLTAQVSGSAPIYQKPFIVEGGGSRLAVTSIMNLKLTITPLANGPGPVLSPPIDRPL